MLINVSHNFLYTKIVDASSLNYVRINYAELMEFENGEYRSSLAYFEKWLLSL